MWISIFVFAFVILLNSFLIGKLYKRFNLYLSSSFCLTLGCVSFFGIFGVILIPLLLFAISFEVIFYVSIIAQAILLLLYLLNWRWFFISYHINWRILLIFIGIFIAFSLGYFATRQYHLEAPWWIVQDNEYFLQFTTTPMREINIFNISGNNFETNFINLFYALFIYTFNVTDLKEIQNFTTIASLFIFTYLGSLICNSMFINHVSELNYAKLLVIILTCFFISVISFIFTEAFWIIIMLLFLIHVHGLKQNQLPSSIAIYVINLTIPCGIIFNMNFLVLALIINLIALLISFRLKRANATDFNILMLFTTLLYLALVLNNKVYLNYIIIAILIVVYSIYLFYKSSNMAYRINKVVDNFMYQYVNWFSIAIGLVIMIASVAIFFTSANYSINLNLWTVSTIGNPPIYLFSGAVDYLLVNVIFWTVNLSALAFAIFNNGWFLKKLKLHSLSIFSSAQLDIPILVALIFWNPINSNIYLTIIESQFLNFAIDFKLVFFTLVIPVLYILAKQVVNYEKISYIDYTYISIIAIISGVLITSLNI